MRVPERSLSRPDLGQTSYGAGSRRLLADGSAPRGVPVLCFRKIDCPRRRVAEVIALIPEATIVYSTIEFRHQHHIIIYSPSKERERERGGFVVSRGGTRGSVWSGSRGTAVPKREVLPGRAEPKPNRTEPNRNTGPMTMTCRMGA